MGSASRHTVATAALIGLSSRARDIRARVKRNRWPGARSGEVIRRWASWAGLQLDVVV
jgi:hypothetical protein